MPALHYAALRTFFSIRRSFFRFLFIACALAGSANKARADGSVDISFDPDANGDVYSLAVQADGKILVGGQFTQIGGQTRIGIARLNADASVSPPDNSAQKTALTKKLKKLKKKLKVAKRRKQVAKVKKLTKQIKKIKKQLRAL